MIVVNGIKQQEISCFDRGLQFGDGLFETIPFTSNDFLLWDEHISRLEYGCKSLNINFEKFDELHSQCLKYKKEYLSENALSSEEEASGKEEFGILKIIITRGDSNRGYLPNFEKIPNSILYFSNFPHVVFEKREFGISAGISKTKIRRSLIKGGIKDLNRVEQVLLSLEADDLGFDEMAVSNDTGEVIEGIKSNIFIVKNDIVVTPPIINYGIEGVMRQRVIAAANDNGLIVKESKIFEKDLKEADEIFFSNSIIGIWPVNSFCGLPLDIARHSLSIQKAISMDIVQPI